jgi:hypothetical protein
LIQFSYATPHLPYKAKQLSQIQPSTWSLHRMLIPLQLSWQMNYWKANDYILNLNDT